MITVANLIQFLKIIAPAWVTGTAYSIGQYVTESSKVYVCLVAHSAGTFATDLGAGKWREMTILGTAVNHGINFVESYCNTSFSGSGTSTSEYFIGEGSSDFLAKSFPVTEVTAIEKFDEDTSAYVTIFTSPDTIVDSVYVTTIDAKIHLYNGYSFGKGIQYKITYKYTSVVPDIAKTVAIEQAARYYINSPEGQAWFSKNSENVGSQATESVSIESQDDLNNRHYKVLDYFRVWNV